MSEVAESVKDIVEVKEVKEPGNKNIVQDKTKYNNNTLLCSRIAFGRRVEDCSHGWADLLTQKAMNQAKTKLKKKGEQTRIEQLRAIFELCD